MLRSFLSDDVVPVDKLARLPAEQLRCRSAPADPFTQLFSLASCRFFGERCLVNVRSTVDVTVPLRSDFLGADFRIHRRKACGYLTAEVNERARCCSVEQIAQSFVLPRVDAGARLDRMLSFETHLAADIAQQIRDPSSKHIRRGSLAFDFLFHPRPAHHATAPSIRRVAQRARLGGIHQA
jgi:hypothetical protein